MNLSTIILQLILLILLLTNSCFGPQTNAQPARTASLGHESLDHIWTVLTLDAKGDGRDPSLADAAMLSYRYDKQQDFLWFRVGLYGTPNPQAFGVNIAIDTGIDDAGKTNWWGGNNAFRFDKLLTAWVTKSTNGYEGTIGVGDTAGVKARHLNNLLQNNLKIRIEGDSILIGVKRSEITDKLKMNLIAAVGSNQQWNDDVPGTGSVVMDLAAERPTRGIREIDLSRNNLEFPKHVKTLPLDKSAPVTRLGDGSQPIILVPGMYSGAHSFDEFMTRNEARYQFFVVTPPGINGTTPRAVPRNTSFGELTWTRLLERDILQLIQKQKLMKPVIVAESHPGSIAAMELALAHPDKIGGVVIAGTNLVQFSPSAKDPSRKIQNKPAERIAVVDESWAAKWFRYVTPETWLSNDMRPEMLSSDIAKGQKARDEVEAAELEVKIRYLCEFWASDVTQSFDKLQVPVLALISAFDEKFLNDPAYRFTKVAYVDSWETLVPHNSKLELVKIADARLLLLQDQPQRAQEAINGFVEKISRTEQAAH